MRERLSCVSSWLRFPPRIQLYPLNWSLFYSCSRWIGVCFFELISSSTFPDAFIVQIDNCCWVLFQLGWLISVEATLVQFYICDGIWAEMQEQINLPRVFCDGSCWIAREDELGSGSGGGVEGSVAMIMTMTVMKMTTMMVWWLKYTGKQNKLFWPLFGLSPTEVQVGPALFEYAKFEFPLNSKLSNAKMAWFIGSSLNSEDYYSVCLFRIKRKWNHHHCFPVWICTCNN